jgi:xanthine dehydrogenase YagS FAD-binding subunit
MQAITLTRPADQAAAIAAARAPRSAYIAGGTDLLQLMKQNVEAPDRLVDIAGLGLHEITADEHELRLGALATMADVAAHPAVKRDWPMISQALLLAASPQIRNMGTMGGNLLQRTRCTYFRDTAFACNKRTPGAGCAAIHGDDRELAIFGVSDHCIASHPSDMPVALVALDAVVDLRTPEGAARAIPLHALYREPGTTPERDTNLAPGEMITAIRVPANRFARTSIYLKVRDRTSFAFALTSAAVALEIDGGTIRDARVAFGGVGSMPWRAPGVEALLRGQPAHEDTFRNAAAHAADGARIGRNNAVKAKLVQRITLRALQTLAA